MKEEKQGEHVFNRRVHSDGCIGSPELDVVLESNRVHCTAAQLLCVSFSH